MLLLKERFLRETRGGETDSLALVQLLLQDSAEIHILLEITSNLASAVRPSGICQPPPVRCSWCKGWVLWFTQKTHKMWVSLQPLSAGGKWTFMSALDTWS